VPEMPYTTEKHEALQVIEDYINKDRWRSLTTLWKLLDGVATTDLEPIRSQNLNHHPYETKEKRIAHVNHDWWGMDVDKAGAWQHQPPFNPHSNPTTGFWEYWYGEAECVFRETMIRAMSVSLGIEREDRDDTAQYKGQERPTSMHGTRHWPITLLWKCPQPWYEGWIEFQEWGNQARDGHVTVVLSTPAHGRKLYTSPLRPPTAVAIDPYNAYKVDPREPAGPNGLWVVSQTVHRKWTRPGSAPSGSTSWAPPPLGCYVESMGGVVCVSISVPDGGAAPAGIPYVP
jgi:hypothetical protein